MPKDSLLAPLKLDTEQAVKRDKKTRAQPDALEDLAHAPLFERRAGWGADQPARRSFGIDRVRIGGRLVGVRQRDVWLKPFGALTHLQKEPPYSGPRLLLVPPLSGHLPFLLRDMAVTLLPDHDVHVADWINARYVPAAAGPFGLEDNITYVMEMIRALGEDATIIALCQGGVPALAAAALLAEDKEPAAPKALVLIAAPIDPLANATRVVRRLRAHPLDWFRAHVISQVAPRYPGAGRRVYPARMQLAGLTVYLARHLAERGELFDKLLKDDGADPVAHPFFEAYASVMDLPSEVFLDTVRLVFHERALARRRLTWRGRPVDCSAIEKTALMTIEGAFDDIAAPGQTAAAHRLCANLSPSQRRRYVLPDSGHFSTFHGRSWRERLAPEIDAFLRAR